MACKLVEDWWEPDLRAEGRWPLLPVPRGAHVVYELWDGEELVYIGYTMDLPARLFAHARDKTFTRWAAERYQTAQQARWGEHTYLDWHLRTQGRLPRYNKTVYG